MIIIDFLLTRVSVLIPLFRIKYNVFCFDDVTTHVNKSILIFGHNRKRGFLIINNILLQYNKNFYLKPITLKTIFVLTYTFLDATIFFRKTNI